MLIVGKRKGPRIPSSCPCHHSGRQAPLQPYSLQLWEPAKHYEVELSQSGAVV